jgi:hypothetical protein
MKYLIKESQLKPMIFRFLDDQGYTIVKKKGNVVRRLPNELHFTNNVESGVSDIMYYHPYSLYISQNLYDQVSGFFGIDENEVEDVIFDWVHTKIDVEILKIYVVNQDGIFGDELFRFND